MDIVFKTRKKGMGVGLNDYITVFQTIFVSFWQ